MRAQGIGEGNINYDATLRAIETLKDEIAKEQAPAEETKEEQAQQDANTEIFGPEDPLAIHLVKTSHLIESKKVKFDTLEEANEYIKQHPKEASEQRKLLNSKKLKPKKSFGQYDTIDPDKRIVSPSKDKAIVKVENPKPNLINKFKKLSKKAKIGWAIALVASGLVIAASIVHGLTSGDTSAMQPAADPTIATHLGDLINQVGDKIQNLDPSQIPVHDLAAVDPSAVSHVADAAQPDFGNQQFNPNSLSGEGHSVHYTADQAQAGTDTMTTNPYYQIGGADIRTADGQLISTEGMTNDEVVKFMEEHPGSTMTTYSDGVGMGHENLEEVKQAIEGGRTR